MKKLLVAVAAVMVSLSAHALDGQLILGNFTSDGTLNARVKFAGGASDGQNVDSGYQIQLFRVSGGSETALTPLATFRSGAGAGTFANTTITIANFGDVSGDATFRLKGFDAGKTYDTALLYRGISGDFTATVNVAPTPATLTRNFPTFTLTQVPEPSTIALAVLGGVALLFRRRK